MAEHTLLTVIRGGDGPDQDTMVAAQVRDVRGSLLRDGAAAGADLAVIDAAIDRAVAAYAHCPVRSFVGVLVERSVREQLALRRRSL